TTNGARCRWLTDAQGNIFVTADSPTRYAQQRLPHLELKVGPFQQHRDWLRGLDRLTREDLLDQRLRASGIFKQRRSGPLLVPFCDYGGPICVIQKGELADTPFGYGQ